MKNIDVFSLSDVLSLNKVNSIGRFQDTKTKGENNYYKLFKAIKGGIVKNEEEAQSFLEIENKLAFSKFKSRYVKKLLLHLESSKTLKNQGALLEHEVYRLYTKAKTLQDVADYRNAVVLYKQVLKDAINVGYINVALLAAIDLRGIFAFTLINKKNFEHYKGVVEKLRRQFNEFQDLMEDYDQLSHLFVVNKRSKELDVFAKVLLHKLEKVDFKDHLHRFKIRYFDQMIFLYSYFDDYENAEKISNKAIKYIDEYQYCRIVDRFLIYYEVIKLNIKRRKFHSALHLLKEVKKLRTFKKYNRMMIQLEGLEFMIYANLKDYDMLVKLTFNLLKEGSVKNYKDIYESWKIREAYCNLLIILGKVSLETLHNHPLKRLKIYKFINDTELYNQDKRGLNISIQLLPLIYFLTKKQYEKIQDRIESLKQYTFKYLRKDDTLRSNCFIKMVLKLPEAAFHPLRTKRYVAKYKKILHQNPAKLTIQFIDTEIIPYEDLWEMIEEIMELNLKK